MKCIDEEIPFEIPESWEWCRLGNLCPSLQYGTSEKSQSEGEVAVLRMGNILSSGELSYKDLVFTSNESDIIKYALVPGDLLFNRTNSSEWVGKTAIYRGYIPAIYAGYIIRFRPILLNLEYVNFVMNSGYEKDYCQSVKTDGVNQSNINAQKLAYFLIPVPPSQEQTRLVFEIQNIFSPIATLEENKISLEQLINQAKSKILDLAIRGKLVPQDPNDEPASVLLERIKIERPQSKKTTKSTSDNSHYGNLPFEIPQSWAWCQLDDILDYEQPTEYIVQTTNYSDLYQTPVLTAGKSFLIGHTDEKQGIFKNIPVIIFDDFTTESKYVDFEFKVKSSAMKMLKANNNVNLRYVFYYMSITKLLGDSHKRYWISEYSKLYIPIPPYEEQERIVHQVKNIFSNLDVIVNEL